MPAIEWQQGPKDLAIRIEDPAVGNGVRDDDDQDVDSAVPKLETESTFEGLQVPQPRLSLAAGSTAAQPNESVPRPAIAGDRQRHLGFPTRAGWQAAPKPLKQRELAGVANGVAVRVAPNVESQADGRRCSTCLTEAHVQERRPFEAAPLSVRHGGARTGRRLTQPCRGSRDPQLLANPALELTSSSEPDVRGAPSRDHAGHAAQVHFRRAYLVQRPVAVRRASPPAEIAAGVRPLARPAIGNRCAGRRAFKPGSHPSHRSSGERPARRKAAPPQLCQES